MCSYCGCRSIKPIGDLSAEHVEIQNLSGDVRRAVHNVQYQEAGDKLVRLARLLREHDAVEELSIYPAMARHTEYSDQVGTFFDEHDVLDSVLDEALDTIEKSGPAAVRMGHRRRRVGHHAGAHPARGERPLPSGRHRARRPGLG